VHGFAWTADAWLVKRPGAVGGCGLRLAAVTARLAWCEIAWRSALPVPLVRLRLSWLGPPLLPAARSGV